MGSSRVYTEKSSMAMCTVARRNSRIEVENKTLRESVKRLVLLNITINLCSLRHKNQRNSHPDVHNRSYCNAEDPYSIVIRENVENITVSGLLTIKQGLAEQAKGMLLLLVQQSRHPVSAARGLESGAI